jgi:AcrR family transcriptional regulator
VSLRQIVSAAGQANTSAVQHHFGSKAGLIQAVFDMRVPMMEAARQAKLDALDREGRSSFEDLLGALLLPIIEIFSDRERLTYARFNLRLLPLSDTEHPYFRSLHLSPVSVAINERMLACFPDLPPDVFNTRLRLAAGLFLEGIHNEPRVCSLKSQCYPTNEMFWDEMFQISLSTFLNPFPPPPRVKADKNAVWDDAKPRQGLANG